VYGLVLPLLHAALNVLTKHKLRLLLKTLRLLPMLLLGLLLLRLQGVWAGATSAGGSTGVSDVE
jgi:hypothetical protein